MGWLWNGMIGCFLVGAAGLQQVFCSIIRTRLCKKRVLYYSKFVDSSNRFDSRVVWIGLRLVFTGYLKQTKLGIEDA